MKVLPRLRVTLLGVFRVLGCPTTSPSRLLRGLAGVGAVLATVAGLVEIAVGEVLPQLRVTLLGFSGSGVPNNVALDSCGAR